MRCLAVLGVGLFWLPKVALAAAKAEPKPELFGGGQWLLSLLSLILVVFLAYWTTRFLAGRYGNLPTRHIKVAESLCLGSNRYLYLLLVNNHALLVGSTEQGLALIKEYDEPGFCEELRLSATANQTMARGKLTNWLAPLLTRQAAVTASAVTTGGSKESGAERLTLFRTGKTNQFKNLLTALVEGQDPVAPPEETSRVEVQERLAESLAKIRAWKTKGRG
jgi:flagellar biogenesis protein FliO